MYNYLLFIHIISAVTAIVAITGYPVIMSCVRTVEQAKFGLRLLEKMAILSKIGGILLLLTGLLFGYQQTYLFGELWYWLALAIFCVILVILAVLLPFGMKQQLELLHQSLGETLPEGYRRSRRRSLRLEVIANFCVVISILLMVFKPF
ncbi:hypothetical protein DRW41_03805 [Neobacillus piezotolerans]|uniref:DUF2269 domain-containing protein n=1 Tax=Neobacillus piezotolerans TaxID=2259171 RepID=A0A3D8GW88_9BACI|nr:DUF2269 family protein [Neobacillus piezotolerans]RDU38695.1 hypothetical protein DRW41_03805 [Neobacillus piezotolerans]